MEQVFKSCVQFLYLLDNKKLHSWTFPVSSPLIGYGDDWDSLGSFMLKAEPHSNPTPSWFL